MKKSDTFISISGSQATNKEGVPYVVLNLFNKELLLFGFNMFWGDKNLTKGDICVSSNNVFVYSKVGSWQKESNCFQLKITCKGVFYVVPNENNEFDFYEAIGENKLEELAIKAFRNMECRHL